MIPEQRRGEERVFVPGRVREGSPGDGEPYEGQDEDE